jgi:hypothetical protein
MVNPSTLGGRPFLGVVALTLLSAGSSAHAQRVARTPLVDGHPLIGVWRFDVPGTKCYEIYAVGADGTMALTSGAQAAETEFTIAARPSARGFYKWVDRITKDNGKPDCLGSITTVGQVVTNFVIVHPSRRQFVLCRREDRRSCIGPFVRQDGT